MKGPGIRSAVVLLVLLLILSTGCISPPKEKTGSESSSGTQASGTPTPSPTPEIIDTQYLTPATPFPTDTVPTPSPTYPISPQVTENPTLYQTIYYNILDFTYSTSAYSYPLESPPLIIDICLEPETIKRNIWYESRYKTHEDVYETQVSISPTSSFEVRVRDLLTGEIVLKEGFGKTYSVDTRKKLSIRTAGDYLIEFSGNDIKATIQMTIPMPPNSTAAPATTLSCPS